MFAFVRCRVIRVIVFNDKRYYSDIPWGISIFIYIYTLLYFITLVCNQIIPLLFIIIKIHINEY